jgi:hypothetical protein
VVEYYLVDIQMKGLYSVSCERLRRWLVVRITLHGIYMKMLPINQIVKMLDPTQTVAKRV